MARELITGPWFGLVIKRLGASIRGQAFYDQDVASRLPVVTMTKR